MRTLLIGFVGMVLFWMTFLLLGAYLYYQPAMHRAYYGEHR